MTQTTRYAINAAAYAILVAVLIPIHQAWVQPVQLLCLACLWVCYGKFRYCQGVERGAVLAREMIEGPCQCAECRAEREEA